MGRRDSIAFGYLAPRLPGVFPARFDGHPFDTQLSPWLIRITVDAGARTLECASGQNQTMTPKPPRRLVDSVRDKPRRHCGPRGPSGQGRIPQGLPSVVARTA